jgi:hypothetical protein
MSGLAGTQLRNLGFMLEGSAGLNPTLHVPHPRGDGVASLLRHTRRTRPAIVRVEWTGGGGHFIVCSRMYHDGSTVFLDPIFGLVQMSRKSLPNYNAHAGELSKYTLDDLWGKITHVITVSK